MKVIDNFIAYRWNELTSQNRDEWNDRARREVFVSFLLSQDFPTLGISVDPVNHQLDQGCQVSSINEGGLGENKGIEIGMLVSCVQDERYSSSASFKEVTQDLTEQINFCKRQNIIRDASTPLVIGFVPPPMTGEQKQQANEFKRPNATKKSKKFREMQSMIKSIKTKEKLLNDLQNVEDVASNLKNIWSVLSKTDIPFHLGKPSRGIATILGNVSRHVNGLANEISRLCKNLEKSDVQYSRSFQNEMVRLRGSGTGSKHQKRDLKRTRKLQSKLEKSIKRLRAGNSSKKRKRSNAKRKRIPNTSGGHGGGDATDGSSNEDYSSSDEEHNDISEICSSTIISSRQNSREKRQEHKRRKGKRKKFAWA